MISARDGGVQCTFHSGPNMPGKRMEVHMFAPKKILAPTDFSEFSDNALEQAVDIARQYESAIYLLHVLGVVQQCSNDYCMSADILEDLRREGMQYANEMIQQQIKKIGEAGNADIVTDIIEASPTYQVILKEQKARDIDLIVIASHGKTGLLHHFGSVADKVARGATCPVYLVRGSK
jgi:universal stress protein A